MTFRVNYYSLRRKSVTKHIFKNEFFSKSIKYESRMRQKCTYKSEKYVGNFKEKRNGMSLNVEY